MPLHNFLKFRLLGSGVELKGRPVKGLSENGIGIGGMEE
jgi:hypothetical protein